MSKATEYDVKQIRENGVFMGLIKGIGYIYQVGSEYFAYNRSGLYRYNSDSLTGF